MWFEEPERIEAEFKKVFSFVVNYDLDIISGWVMPLNPALLHDVEEFRFETPITGRKAIEEFQRMNREPANMYSIGIYLAKNQRVFSSDYKLIGIGYPRFIGRSADMFIPVFYTQMQTRVVRMWSISADFSTADRFLLKA